MIMKSAWNLVGMGLWLLLIVYFAYIIHDMRARRLRLIVTEKKSFTWHNFWISFGELAIFLLFLWGCLTRHFSKTSRRWIKPDYYQLLIQAVDYSLPGQSIRLCDGFKW